MGSRDEIAAEIDRAAGMVEAFRTAAVQGSAIDLSGLDRKVEGLCGEIAGLPKTDRSGLKDPLLALIDDLNRLVEVIQAQQNGISEDLKDISSRQRAVSAYGKGATAGDRDEPGKKPK